MLATVVAATLHVFRLACIVWLCTLTLQTISAEKAAALFSHTWQGVSPCNYVTDDYSHTVYPYKCSYNIAPTVGVPADSDNGEDDIMPGLVAHVVYFSNRESL